MRSLALAFVLMICACSHTPDVAPSASHDAEGCVRACPGASVVETSPNGEMCRCWSHTAGLQYTFVYPDDDAKLSYSRSRWQHSIAVITGCKTQGLGWEPSEDGKDMHCVAAQAEPKPEQQDWRKTAMLGSP